MLWKVTSLHEFLKNHQGPINMWLVYENLQSCSEPHCLILSKKRIWPNTCKSIKDSSKIFNLYHSSLKERKKTFVLLKENFCDQEAVCLLNYEFPKHKGDGSLCGSEVVKEFYKDSGILKWIAWGLDIGTRSGRTNINRVCKFSLPLSQ